MAAIIRHVTLQYFYDDSIVSSSRLTFNMIDDYDSDCVNQRVQ